MWLYLKRPVGDATFWTIMGAYLLLPVGTEIKFEGVPSFDKSSIPNLAALVGCMLLVRRPLKFWTGFGFVAIPILVYLISPFITAELNSDPIVLANRIVPAETHYDALSAVVGQFLALLPFFLGRQLFRSSHDIEKIMRFLVIAGLVYSLPMLFEVRMSPQLHYWFYGYHASEFVQSMRDGGFRPMVFMGHGLLTALFIMQAVVASAALWRTQTSVQRLPPAGVTAYLSVVLVLCKTLGALIYGAILVPLVRFAKPRTQARIALIFVVIALLYPTLRYADLVPTNAMVEAGRTIDSERAQSLHFRFSNEDKLLDRASARFLFGWGRWGRSRIYEEGSGKDISVTDGRWITTIGQFGLIGFLAEFGLLVLPVFRAASALSFTESTRDRVYLAALTLIMAINVVDLLPNSGLRPWTWLLMGALLGRAEALIAQKRQKIELYSIANKVKVSG